MILHTSLGLSETLKYDDNYDISSKLLNLNFNIFFQPDLIKQYGYPVEVHHVTTADGYILEMHRIPHGRHKNNVPDKNKPVVILQHGLLCSSSVWVLMGPSTGFGKS